MGFRKAVADFFRGSSGRDADPAIRHGQAETRSADLTQQLSTLVLGNGTAAGVNMNPERGRALATAYACVDLRSRLLSSLPLKLYRKTARGREEVTDHPAAKLFSMRPNGAQTRSSFIAWSQQNIDTRGNAVARVVRDPATYRPVALLPLSPLDVDPKLLATGDVIYQWRGTNLTRADVLHVPGNDLRASDGIWGVSPVSRLSETFGLAVATQQQAARFMANDATPPLWLKALNGKPDDKQVELIRQALAQQTGGVNRGKPGLLWGVEPVPIGFNAQDTQLLESRQFDVDEVCRVYGVPGELVGAKGASSWGTGIGEKIQGFVKFTILPICTAWEQALDWTLLTEAEKEAGYFFAFTLEALMRGDLKARAEVYKLLREIRAVDINQIRTWEDWEQYPDAWAGDPREPLNNQGGGNSAAQPASTENAP